ncbi:hypothetical protein GCM10010343_00420 [Streptomyces avidinii]|nr:hypothetical protein GCM10010343_00420 [Streptomyces avidinii]
MPRRVSFAQYDTRLVQTCTGVDGAAEGSPDGLPEGVPEPAAEGGAEDRHPDRASAARRMWAAYRAVRGMVPMRGR